MNKKILLAIITTFLFLTGCWKNISINTAQQNRQSTITTSDAIDYNQYAKKAWIVKNGTDNGPYDYPTFCISKIENGKITGKFSRAWPVVVPSHYYYLPDHFEEFTGTIDQDTVKCQLSGKKGYNGNIQLVFKANDEIEATIKYADESQNNKYYHEGTFQFKPYNLNDEKAVGIIEDKSFTVDLNSWGNVRIVSGKATEGEKHPTAFFLTDKDGDILYDFDLNIYNVDVNEVSCQDVNKDGLKDLIIIIGEPYSVPAGTGKPLAAHIFYQKTDGSFDSDSNVDEEINNSGNYKDVKNVTDYLSKK